jgi:hypothetical protein
LVLERTRSVVKEFGDGWNYRAVFEMSLKDRGRQAADT